MIAAHDQDTLLRSFQRSRRASLHVPAKTSPKAKRRRSCRPAKVTISRFRATRGRSCAAQELCVVCGAGGIFSGCVAHLLYRCRRPFPEDASYSLSCFSTRRRSCITR
jgi:hypothetical protein